MDIESIRKEIPVTQQMSYMNTGWEGPSPIPVVEAVHTRMSYENQIGPTTNDALDTGKEIRRQLKLSLASLINASTEEILLTQNTTEGINIVLNGLPWQKGDEVITCNLEHPSILLPTYHLQNRYGVKVKVLQFASNAAHSLIISTIQEAISDRTRMIFLSHVEYSCGLRMPIEEISRMSKLKNIWLLVDGAQGPGHIHVDISKLGCDFYAMPGQKWLLGPDGTGALFIKKSMIPIVQPDRVSSSAVKDYDHTGLYTPETDEVDKFTLTTTSTPLQAGFLEALKFITSIGMNSVSKRSAALASSLSMDLSKIPFVKVISPTIDLERTSLVSFAIANVDHEIAIQYLWDNNRIVVRWVRYPDSLRASIAFFNTDDEVAQLISSIQNLTKNL